MAVARAAREISEIGPRFFTEDSLVLEMQKELREAGVKGNFRKWDEHTVSLWDKKGVGKKCSDGVLGV